ncbi:hypothetical protein [Candidatus Methylomirabilis sp.]|uniref:hypothetical protein n=1 Tax=Candidatus Methylomirabilis sp. TaxID=2032687 RepID=UPI003076681E
MQNLSEKLRLRQADLADELVQQSKPLTVIQARLRDLARPWPVDYDPRDFKEAEFRWLTDLLHALDEARSLRDAWTSTIAALTRESEALKVKLEAGELDNADYDRDRERYHIRKVEIEAYREALARLEDGLKTAEREWERVKPIAEGEIERYADTLFMAEQRELQKEVEEMLTKAATVRTHAGTLNRWHVTLREQYGLTVTPRKVTFDPALPTAHSFTIRIERVSHA